MFRRSSLGRLAAPVVLVALSVAVVVLLTKSTKSVVNDLVGYSTVLALLVAFYMAFRDNGKAGNLNEAEYEQVVNNLSQRVTYAEGLQRRRLLGLASEPAPTRLSAAHFLPSYRVEYQPIAASLNNIFEAFWNSKSRRLVLLGEAGAGKTLVLLEIIRQAAMYCKANQLPLLVRINVAEWRSDQSFREFITRRIATEQALSVKVVERMFDERKIVPLLDGLDELDPDQSPPIRGRDAVAALNEIAHGSYPIDAPLIVTCRRGYFERLEELQMNGNSNPSQREKQRGLAGAGCLMLENLDTDQILAYLRNNLTEEARVRWQPILKIISSMHPSVESSYLSDVLGSPWLLMLAFHAYANQGNPQELLEHKSAQDIEARLLPQFLTVAMQWHGQGVRKGSRKAVEQGWIKAIGSDRTRTAIWLRHIAIYLEKDREEGGGAGEFALFQLYRMVDGRRFRILFGGCVIVAASAITALITFTALSGSHSFARIVAIFGAATFFVGGVYIAIFRPPDTPAGASFAREIRTPDGLLDLGISFFCGLAASVFALETSNTLTARILGGACCGLLAGLFFGFVHSRRVRKRGIGMIGSYLPTDPMRGGLWDSSIIGLPMAVLYGVLLFFEGAGVPMTLVFCACMFAVFSPVLGMPVTSVAWSRYRLASLMLFLQRKLPWRLATFLQWSYDSGLMRVSGLSYQFRHLRLQKWLAKTDQQDLLRPS